MFYTNTCLCIVSVARAGLKSLAGLSLAIALSTSNTVSAQEVTPTPTPSCPPDTFKAMLTGAQEVPPNNSTATGIGHSGLKPGLRGNNNQRRGIVYRSGCECERCTHSRSSHARGNRTGHNSFPRFSRYYIRGLLKYFSDHARAS